MGCGYEYAMIKRLLRSASYQVYDLVDCVIELPRWYDSL